ncbi:hypothetical protein AX15_004660 [Amanita polypyramis BW_CC]|nr:hypothetical protein AX15_004660 [Amanita polypyramis BW_CC]
MLSLNAHRVLAYSLLSALAVSLTVANALRNYSNFYSVAIYLSKSSRSVLVLANFGFLVALLCGHFVQRLFFGTLRPTEVERLYDRLWFFITESLLAFTIFRDEFDIPFALMFGFLLFVKSFHWLAGDRIEWMDQVPYPGPPLLFHIRMSTLFVILWITDFIMFLVAVESTLSNGVGGMVLFASEYGILVASVMNTISKYLLSVYDLRRSGQRGGENAPPWENKSMWVFYIELATDFLKLTTYLIFFLVIIAFYGLPLNIVRDVYMTARSFITRLRALHRYQTATRNMDQRYPNATEDELRAMNDRTCIICREEMIAQESGQTSAREGPNVTPKKLPCGHVFHFHCLRSWLERQQSCPTCRRTVFDNNQSGNNTPGQPQGPGVNPLPGGAAAENGINVQQRNNLPGRNPFGFIGRLFAPPMQAPNGAFVPNNPGVGANLANVAGQVPHEVLIQYRIQYPQQQTVRGLEPLQPVPQFLGFVGPGGAWQPWPAVVEPNNQERQNDGPANRPATAEPGPSRTIPAESTANSPSTQNPREAAALAALRRLDSGSSPRRPVDDNSNGSFTGSSRPTAAERDNVERILFPELIPLYDLKSTRPGQNTVPGESHPSVGARTRSSPYATYSGNPHRSQPTLTEEQLAIMDHVTREAIDERLRVLEEVSVTICRCIDDLMRMRSVLPSPGIPDEPRSEEGSTGGSASSLSDPTPEASRNTTTGKSEPSESVAGPSTTGNNGDVGVGSNDTRHHDGGQYSSTDI